MYRGNVDGKTARWIREHSEPVLIVIYGKGLSPLLKPADVVVVEPVSDNTYLGKGDIVFCKVNKHYCLRRILLDKQICESGYRVGNARTYINGIIPRADIYGRVVRILK